MITSCDSGNEWKSGDYAVYWIDSPSNRSLGFELKRGTYLGRVGPQVFAVGEDERWIVAGRFVDGDKKNAEFYYFSKNLDGKDKNSEDVVRGPFDRSAYLAEKHARNLPDLSVYFDK